MEVLKYNIRGYGKQPFVGILLCKGSKWIVFADNTVDYVIDGICLINVHYYKERISVECESTLFKVLSYKYSINKYGKDVLSGINTYDDNAFFHYLCLQKELLEISFTEKNAYIRNMYDANGHKFKMITYANIPLVIGRAVPAKASAKAATALTCLVYNIFRYVQINKYQPQLIASMG